MHRCGRYALGLALDMIPISTCDSEQAPDMYVTCREDATLLNQESCDVISTPLWTSNEQCRRKMTDLVQELIEKGDL
ncbi:hypothetical protein PR048_025091 [Dryococelus australis]|uniref:Uncharacterized protein n=1 Tax=Dryococelus australis TaxID=614101 RepID=A0ABQ9GQE6_9NEOP|nr:hypothetical protein PR048_025091 [Dryococelus australis]